VGFVGIWNRPNDPLPWSGVPYRIMEALKELGAFGGYLDATPWPRVLHALRALDRRLARDAPAWFFGPGPQRVLSANNAARRWTHRGGPNRWVVPAMGLGLPVRGRVASLSEMSPAQLRNADLDVVRTFWPGIDPSKVERLARQAERLHRTASVCCVASHWTAASLVADHGIDASKVRVVGYGTNLTMEPPADRDWSTPRFLFSGLAWERKNGDRVVRAFTRLREHWPNATLDVIGEHPRINVEGVIEHGRRTIHEPDGRQLLIELHRRATCFVLPSLLEPFGLVYVEAGTAGIPSIGTTEGGTADSIGDGGVRVDPLDEAALFQAMMRMANETEARELGQRALVRSRRFTWRQTAERIVRSLALPDEETSDLAPFL
jgi:glycosyltransferase involved in cell wall biosynthesis